MDKVIREALEAKDSYVSLAGKEYLWPGSTTWSEWEAARKRIIDADAALSLLHSAPEHGDGSEEHPFTHTFSGKGFKRHDSGLFVGICERDDGFEILVTPANGGPRHDYRIDPDAIVTDLAKPAPEAPKVFNMAAECPECGTAIMINGFGAHHSAACSLVGHNFKEPAHSVPAPSEEDAGLDVGLNADQCAHLLTANIQRKINEAMARGPGASDSEIREIMHDELYTFLLPNIKKLDAAVKEADALRDQLAASEERVREMREALEPFAAMAEAIGESRPSIRTDEDTVYGFEKTRLSLGDFKRARAALGRKE